MGNQASLQQIEHAAGRRRTPPRDAFAFLGFIEKSWSHPRYFHRISHAKIPLASALPLLVPSAGCAALTALRRDVKTPSYVEKLLNGK